MLIILGIVLPGEKGPYSAMKLKKKLLRNYGWVDQEGRCHGHHTGHHGLPIEDWRVPLLKYKFGMNHYHLIS